MTKICDADALTSSPSAAIAGVVVPPATWDRLGAAYGSPGRAYHTLAHVREVLRRFDEVAAECGWDRPAEVYLAVLFHDAVYVPGATDNEEKSAELARAELTDAHGAPVFAVDGNRVEALIRLTARHGSLQPSEVDRDAGLFLDCDMAILGADEPTYDAYEAGIAEEYSALPSDVFRAGRRAFLARLVARPRIFFSDHFHARLAAKARANLQRAIARL